MTALTPSLSRSTTTTAACTLRTFEVIVLNVNPAFVPPSGGGSFEGDDVTSEGITTIRVDFEDPGFDNTANPNAAEPPTVTDTLHESFTHVINWGDGTIDAVHTYADSGVYTVTVTMTGPDGVQMFSFPGFDSMLQPVLTLVSSQAINDPMAVGRGVYVRRRLGRRQRCKRFSSCSSSRADRCSTTG